MHRRPLVTLAAGAILVAGRLLVGRRHGALRSPRPRRRRASRPAPRPARPPPGPPAPRARPRARSRSSIEGFAFDPATSRPRSARRSTFTNGDSAPHTATLDDGVVHDAQHRQGASDGLTFTAAGTYPFHCNVHPNMKGTITVS